MSLNFNPIQDWNEYGQVYKALGIPIKPLPSNYTPDEFGRKLRSMSQTEHGVSYAASTDYVVIQGDPK